MTSVETAQPPPPSLPRRLPLPPQGLLTGGGGGPDCRLGTVPSSPTNVLNLTQEAWRSPPTPGHGENRSPQWHRPLPLARTPSSATVKSPDSLLRWQEPRHEDAPLTHTAPPLALGPSPAEAGPPGGPVSWHQEAIAPQDVVSGSQL